MLRGKSPAATATPIGKFASAYKLLTEPPLELEELELLPELDEESLPPRQPVSVTSDATNRMMVLNDLFITLSFELNKNRIERGCELMVL